MNFTDIAEWDRCTMEMIKNPKQGDHFTEHLGSVLLVTHRFGNRFTRWHYIKPIWFASVRRFNRWQEHPMMMYAERLWIRGVPNVLTPQGARPNGD
jgi:hypothetical protein